MCVVCSFEPGVESDALYKALLITAPLALIDRELSGVMMIWAPILFLVATVIIDLMPEFTKNQKIVLTVMPVVSYALYWILGFAADAYFRV